MAQAIIINSGNANTCTGVGGARDVTLTAERVAEKLGCSSGGPCSGRYTVV